MPAPACSGAPGPQAQRRDERDQDADGQAQQGQDQPGAEFLDVVAKAHGGHRLLFVEEVVVGWAWHGIAPPADRSQAVRLHSGGSEGRRRGALRPVPRPWPVSGAARGLAGTAVAGGSVPAVSVYHRPCQRPRQGPLRTPTAPPRPGQRPALRGTTPGHRSRRTGSPDNAGFGRAASRRRRDGSTVDEDGHASASNDRASSRVPQGPAVPLRFEPILKSLIWGGRRLGSVLNKPIGDGATYAESWEAGRPPPRRQPGGRWSPRRAPPSAN